MNAKHDLTQHAARAVALLKELSNESRLIICCCLGDNEMSVGELNREVPLSQSALSQHLARLREAGIVSTRKQSQTVYYRLADSDAQRVIATLRSIYCP